MIKPEEIQSLTLRDPLSFGIIYLDLGQKREWDVAGRQWIIEPYAQVNPWEIEKYPVGTPRKMSIMKSTQAGISTLSLTKMFHFASNWDVRIFYTLPRQQDVTDMVTTRVDPMIKASPYLAKLKGAEPDSVHAKRIGDSFLYFMELSVEPRMLPADALYVDEVDLSDINFMGMAQNRMDASVWKLQTYLSTPTLSNYGIHALYLETDQREWLVKCEKCGKEQELDWEKTLHVNGPANKPTDVYYGCMYCDARLSAEQIQKGRWVPKNPDVTDNPGYHIHQMLTHNPVELYKVFRDPLTTTMEFYRKRLGKPYELGGGSLTRDDILSNCFLEPFPFETIRDGESGYYMGVDQGNELQVLVGKIEPHSTFRKIVHVELVPLEKGFDRVAQLMDLYKVKKAVIDGNPNRHEAIKMVRRFPGRVLVADYSEQREVFVAKKGIHEKALKNIVTTVTINRTAAFDAMMDEIHKSMWGLPGDATALHPDIELVIDHLTAIKRDVEVRKQRQGTVEVAVWRHLRPDHLAHAWSYLKVAMDVARGKRSRVAIIGANQDDEEPEPEDENKPKNEIITGIVGLLAEVPVEQLAEYSEHRIKEEEYEMPFPLSYKLKRVQENYEDEDIMWVIDNMFLKEYL